MRPRQIASVAVVLGLTIAGFIVARGLAERDARRDADRRAEVAAAQIRGRVAQAASLTESLRRFMLDAGGTGVTSDEFSRNALRWLSPAEFPAAAWVERIGAADRAAYERRLGQRIVTSDERHRVAPISSRSSYLPATVVSGFDPMALPGTDLSREPGIATALRRATRLDGVAATPVGGPRTGRRGLFLVSPVPNLVGRILRPGYVVLFVPDPMLRAATADPATVQITAAGASTKPGQRGKTASRTFSAAAQRFDVVVPRESVGGAAAALPWLIVVAGLGLAGLVAALGVNAARRGEAQADLDRIFNLSSDLIVVADFEGRFTRVNPAGEEVLGYTEEEFLARPYLDFVHPEDRERTAVEAAALGEGKTTQSFENRFACKDGSYRLLEWKSTPVVKDRLMYGMARDVTERRQAETQVEHLADEQAALRRVATLVARDVSPQELFGAVAREVGTLLGADYSGMLRYEDEANVATAAIWAAVGEHPPVPDRFPTEPGDPMALIAERREPARVDDWAAVAGPIAAVVRTELGVRSSVGSPIVVKGRLWGALAVHSKQSASLPPDTESRIAQFTDLVGTAIANAEARAEVERLAAEQAALRRVATLVARQASQAEIFTAIADEIGRLLGAEGIRMVRYEDDRSALAVASSGIFKDVLPPIGAGQPLGGENATTRVFRTGEPARIDDYATANGSIAESTRAVGIRSVVATPIMVEGRLWGAMGTGTTQDEPLPPETESRLGQFTELLATAIGNTESHAKADRLAGEQAALQRVATLVAKESSPAELLAKVAEEASNVLGGVDCGMFRDEGDGTVSVAAVRGAGMSAGFPLGTRLPVDGNAATAFVLREGRPYRVDDYSTRTGTIARRAREHGIGSAVGCPIRVRGGIWGAMIVARFGATGPLPPQTETRIAQFAELVATAIANAEARAEVKRLADEQAALRRVATLVAREAPQREVFTAIADEIGHLLGADYTRMVRFADDRGADVVASSGATEDILPIGSRVPLDGETAISRVFRTQQPARIDDLRTVSGEIAAKARAMGVRAVVATPVLVEGRLWGAMAAGTTQDASLPPETESRLGQFTELMATAIANTEARAEVERLADEQAALRRVATLVAKEAPAAEVFAKVVEELANVIGDADCSLFRAEGDGTATAVALWGPGVSGAVRVGSRWPVDGDGVVASVLREGRPRRIGEYSGVAGAIGKRGQELGIRSAVACPVVVRGRIWGVMGAARYQDEAFPPETETRIGQFADLAATAIANAAARTEVERLADEQAALRRVATVVAQTASPSEVFELVTREVGLLSGADLARMERYEPDGTVAGVAGWSRTAEHELAVGTRFELEGTSIAAQVRETGRATRVDSFEQATGPIAQEAISLGIRASVGCPIIVEHRLWGVIAASSKGEEPFPAGTESQIAEFTELVATAIANADSRDQLTASRTRLLTAADEARRRVVRDLHDGAQQRLVHTVITLKLAQQSVRQNDGKAASIVAEALEHAQQSNAELRELAHGILPSVLTRGGLRAGVDAFVTRLDLPVQADVTAERFPAEIEASAYFIVAEALTNVVKHAHAEHAEVTASVQDGMLRLEVRDDGIGGVDPRGNGLVGMGDRVTALGGRLNIESPAGGGTHLAATLPVSAR